MKKMALLVALTALSTPLHARNLARLSRMTTGNPASITFSDVDPQLPGRLLAQLRARRVAHAQGVHASAVTDSISARSFIIPAAGSTAGGGGTLFFHSDVTLVNYRDTPQLVLAGFWVQGSTNSLDFSHYKTLTLPPNQFVTIQDFVATGLNLSGLGALVFIPYTGSDFDNNSAIDGFSRIYTKQPGSTGTVSQPFDAINPDTLSVQYIDEGVAMGLRQDADFRTNVGIVNVESQPHVYKLTFSGERLKTTQTVTVPAFGMIQQAIPAGDYGALQIVYQVVDATASAFVSWVGYASSTDNVTGDGWVAIASADFTPEQLDLIGY